MRSLHDSMIPSAALGRSHGGKPLTFRRRRASLALLTFAAASAVGGKFGIAAIETWDPAKTGGSGGSGTWDTTTPNWDLTTFTGAGGNTTTWTNTNSATFGGTAGTVTVAPGGITVGVATFGTVGYTVTGGPITFTSAAPQLYAAGSTSTGVGTTTVNSVLTGTAGLKFAAGGYSVGTLVLGGLNTYTGPTTVSQISIFFTSLANAGTASSFGMGDVAGGTNGYVTLGSSTSTIRLYNTGVGGSTDRLFQFGGSGTEDIVNNGTGSLSFTNAGSPNTGTVGARKLQLDGSFANAGTLTLASNINNFGETLSDMGSGASVTNVTLAGGTWALSATNTYSGGTFVGPGSQLVVTNSASLGTGTLSYTGSGTVSATSGLTLNNPISAASGITANFNNFTTTGGVGNTFVVSGLISGSGGVKLSTPSNNLNAPIEISNDSNTFTGLFSAGNGFIQYTSVANSGVASALGAGTIGGNGTISILNGSSFATFQYVGGNVDSTNRPLLYTSSGASGNLALDSSGAGAVQFLATNPLRAATGTTAGSNTNTLFLAGTSTGNNVLAQPINDIAAVNLVVAGVTTVTKQGAGLWITTAANGYSGPTNITGGNFTVDASDPGATLTGVNANANASIVNSGTVTLAAAGTLHLLNSAAAAPVSMLSSTALVSVVTGSQVLLDLNGKTQSISTFVVNSTVQDPNTYGSSTYFASLGIDPSTLTTEQTNDEIFFGNSNGAFVAAPEPTTISLAGIAIASFAMRRRRRGVSDLT